MTPTPHLIAQIAWKYSGDPKRNGHGKQRRTVGPPPPTRYITDSGGCRSLSVRLLSARDVCVCADLVIRALCPRTCIQESVEEWCDLDEFILGYIQLSSSYAEV